MKVTRRGVLGMFGAGIAGGLSRRGHASASASGDDPLAGASGTTSICPFCAVGCGIIVWSRDGRVVRVEGDSEHPINRGSLCSKAEALPQIVSSPGRVTRVMYRAPRSDAWEQTSWDWAMPRIAARIKETRDATFVAEHAGVTVNRTQGIACLGGAALDNEECYLYVKLARGLGVTFIEHQARL